MNKEEALQNDLTYNKVENFIKKLHEKNIALHSDAKTFMVSENTGKDFFGKALKESKSLANRIAEEIADYEKIVNSERMAEAIITESEKGDKKNTIEATEDFVHYIDIRSALRKRKLDVGLNLLRYIEVAYCNNYVQEIGLGNQLFALMAENERLKKENANLTDRIAKTEDAHELLYSLENKLRQFVETKIKEGNGNIDESMIKDWLGAKRKEAQPQRKPIDCALINYSTFDQLKKIIIQNNNWDKIFKPYFRRQDGVISRINELDDIRDTIAHNRKLSVFDYDCFMTLNAQILNCIQNKEATANQPH